MYQKAVVLTNADSHEDVGLDGRLQDQHDDEQGQKQEAAHGQQSHAEHAPAVRPGTGSDIMTTNYTRVGRRDDGERLHNDGRRK